MLVTLWWCVAPLRLEGLRGKKSTPSVWLGGTGELIEVGKQEHGATRCSSAGLHLQVILRRS